MTLVPPPPELLTVHWNKLMRFEGSFAEFHGNIQAEQASSRLTCQMLQVYFDKPVSLSDTRNAPKKERGKGEEPAFVVRPRRGGTRPARPQVSSLAISPIPFSPRIVDPIPT